MERGEGVPSVIVDDAAVAAAAAPPSELDTGRVARTEGANGDVGATAVMAEITTALVPARVVEMVDPVRTSVVVPLVKKKRGRPRKYGPGKRAMIALNTMTISAEAAAPFKSYSAGMKPLRTRPVRYISMQQPQQAQRIDFDNLGMMVACSSGANFTPHVLNVAAGEDVAMKIISFSQQGPRALCVLSANGIVSNVTLRQPDSSGGTLTYEGCFELLSLSGLFMPTDNEGTRTRSGGISVSLASSDGRVLGGGVAGVLVAAGPIQVVLGSFLPSYQMEQKTKKPRHEPASSPISTTPAVVISAPGSDGGDIYGLGRGSVAAASAKQTIITAPAAFRLESWPSSMNAETKSSSDIHVSLPGG